MVGAGMILQWGRRCSATEGHRAESPVLGLGLLQWGRRCSATEGADIRKEAAELERLQWGRRCSATEGLTSWDVSSVSCLDFNGAVAVQRRKETNLVVSNRYGETSMGPSLFSDGREVPFLFEPWDDTPLQWGRRCSATEGFFL